MDNIVTLSQSANDLGGNSLNWPLIQDRDHRSNPTMSAEVRQVNQIQQTGTAPLGTGNAFECTPLKIGTHTGCRDNKGTFPATQHAMIVSADWFAGLTAYRNHIVALDSAHQWLRSLPPGQGSWADPRIDEIISQPNRIWKQAVPTLIAAEVGKYVIDKQFFPNASPSPLVLAADMASPFVVLSRLPWQAKLAVIVGSHLATRVVGSVWWNK